MNGLIRHARFALGAVALLALAASCSKEQKPAQQPTPTFESRVGEPATPPAEEPMQPPMQQPSMEQPPAEKPMSQPPPQPAPSEPPSGQMTPPATQPAPMAVSERELCDDLSRDAIMKVEDIQGGVAVILSAKPGTDMGAVRDDARKIEHAMTPEGGMSGSAPSAGEQCGLFNLGRAGARAVVSEGPNSIRLLFTSPDAAVVKVIRKDAHDYTKAHGGSTKAPKGEPKNP